MAEVTAPVWPTRADKTCDHCRATHVVATLYIDGRSLCAECQLMPSRVAEYRTAEEMRHAQAK